MSDKAMSLADARNEAQKATAARERLTALFDPDSFVEVGALVKNGCDGTGVITGYGLVEGSPVYAFSQDSTVRNGAVGAAHGSKIKKIYDLAVKTGAPVVGIYDSNGAAVDEGLDALAAYGEMLLWTNNLSGVVPQVSRRGGRLCGQRGADRRLRRLRRHERGRRTLFDPRRRGFRDRRGQRGQVGRCTYRGEGRRRRGGPRRAGWFPCFPPTTSPRPPTATSPRLPARAPRSTRLRRASRTRPTSSASRSRSRTRTA